ncbi:MAG: Dna2/Cas4 domain-containing protein [Chloroflexi bacterium]|nr:Dna2/Cas4 domain-containing protein [Chloroflexota bacterium]
MFKQSRNMRQQSGVPAGNIIYTDTGTWFPNSDSLYAQDVRLVGKPDYLVEDENGTIIPVELKSGRAPDEPWEGHILQLAAYCLLVEEQYGVRPEFGIIQYKDKAFAVDYTDDLEDNLLDVLAEMRQDRYEIDVLRDHNDWQLCANCGMNRVCDQRIA